MALIDRRRNGSFDHGVVVCEDKRVRCLLEVGVLPVGAVLDRYDDLNGTAQLDNLDTCTLAKIRGRINKIGCADSHVRVVSQRKVGRNPGISHHECTIVCRVKVMLCLLPKVSEIESCSRGTRRCSLCFEQPIFRLK